MESSEFYAFVYFFDDPYSYGLIYKESFIFSKETSSFSEIEKFFTEKFKLRFEYDLFVEINTYDNFKDDIPAFLSFSVIHEKENVSSTLELLDDILF